MLSIGVGSVRQLSGTKSRDKPNVLSKDNRNGDAYKIELLNQIEANKEAKRNSKFYEEVHPLESRVQKHGVQKLSNTEAVEEDVFSFFIGDDQKELSQKKRESIKGYREQLDRDIAHRKQEESIDAENIYHGRKPVVRSFSPNTFQEFVIGADPDAVKLAKRKQATEFRKQQEQNAVNISKTRERSMYIGDTTGFFIGGDEKVLNDTIALKRIQYKDALDAQVSHNDENKNIQRYKLLEEDLDRKNYGRLPYSKY